MPWVVATYPRKHVDGAAGILAALLTLLGRKLLHWSIRVSLCGTSEAVLHLEALPETLQIEGLDPVWAECSVDDALREATLHRAAVRKLPAQEAHEHAVALCAELELHAKKTCAAAIAERVAAAPVRFGVDADTLGECIAPGIYLTATPSATEGYASVPVRAMLNFTYRVQDRNNHKLHSPGNGYWASFWFADFGDCCMRRLEEIWKARRNYPNAIKEMGISATELGHYESLTYELRLYLSAVGGIFPPKTFECWSYNGGTHCFRRGTRVPSREDLLAVWEAWTAIGRLKINTPLFRNNIASAWNDGRNTVVKLERSSNGDFVLTASFDISTIPIGQLIRQVDDVRTTGTVDLLFKLEKEPDHVRIQHFIAKSSDIRRNAQDGSISGTVYCVWRDTKEVVDVLPRID